MSRNTLIQLYAEHTGKLSDKWSLYLAEYDRLFSNYRNEPIRLLEIGVQNGGSLDIWSKYFCNASALVGCDINPDCVRLNYDDPCISVIVGDANAHDVRKQVLQRSPKFDIIIDDGSHLSSDIIKSFALYFPHIVEGGLFVAEDMHCSYWEQLEGGLFDPYSSISFFKHLADVINHEHWGVPKERADILRGSFAKYGCEVDEETLSQVHSVEFINSMCVVHKAPVADNGLGRRIIAGSIELVVSGHQKLHGVSYQLDSTMYDQSNNPWTARTTPPDEAIQNMELSLTNAQQQIVSLNQSMSEREEQIASLNQSMSEREEQIASLSQLVKSYQDSTSWWLTKPLRFVGRKVNQARLANRRLKELGSRFFHGETKDSEKITLSHIRLHLDKPNRIFKIVDDPFVISGWSIDLHANAAASVRIRIGKVVHQLHATIRDDVQQAFASICDLPAHVGFDAMPSLTMGLHRMWIDVKDSDGTWIPVRSLLLLRLPEIMHEELRDGVSYRAWTRIEQNQLKAELSDISRHIEVMLHKPLFTVVVDTRQGLVGWENSLQSICKQIYPHYELRVLGGLDTKLSPDLEQDGKPLLDNSLTDVLGDFIIFIESGQSLSSNALYEFANAINQYPDIDLIYGDEDRLNPNGEQCAPFYKPDWSPDYLETFNYISFPTCFRTTVARGRFEDANLYGLALRITENTTNIWHVAKILGHAAELQIGNEAMDRASAQDISALQGRLNRTGRHGTVSEHKLYRGCYDIQLELNFKPLVSIIIPTAGQTVAVEGRNIDLIINIIDQIRSQSTYKNIEIIVVDNDDLSEDQQRVLTDHGCKRITYTEPVFNISKKLNLGASIANGELLLLMNDDIEILMPNWIERMVEHFEKPHVGVVGAKLLYPNELTQHVGVVHNYGNPDHVRRFHPRDEEGYYFSTCGVRNFMAVTGAVMMTSSNIYREVGGYSEELAVSYNDADYCLKVQAKGLWIVYAPKVELIHMESQSRVASADMNEVAWYHNRWASQIVSDPYYNEQFLTVASPTFVPYVNLRKI